MFHDFGASPLNFTMAKATGFQSVFSPACKPTLKESPNNSIPATEIKRWNLISLVDARFPFGGGIFRDSCASRHLVPVFRVYGTRARKSTMGMKAPRADLKKFRDTNVTVFLLALSRCRLRLVRLLAQPPLPTSSR